jgi:hypothetical protein
VLLAGDVARLTSFGAGGGTSLDGWEEWGRVGSATYSTSSDRPCLKPTDTSRRSSAYVAIRRGGLTNGDKSRAASGAEGLTSRATYNVQEGG